MRFTVIWKRNAEAELTQIWTDAQDRKEVREAADQLDKLLGNSPLEVGESRMTDYRVTFIKPLGFEFRVSPADRRVVVVRVWRIA